MLNYLNKHYDASYYAALTKEKTNRDKLRNFCIEIAMLYHW